MYYIIIHSQFCCLLPLLKCVLQNMKRQYIYKHTMFRLGFSGAPGLVDRVFAVHAGSRGFDSHRRHISEQVFLSNRPEHPHPVCSELENSGIRVAVGSYSVTEARGWGGVRLIKPAKLYMCTQKPYNTTRTDMCTQKHYTQRGRTHSANGARPWFCNAEPH